MFSSLTPDLGISIDLDRPASVQQEPFFAKQRMLFEIREPVLTNVEQLASGVWILKPQNTSLTTLHETTDGQATIVRLSQFVHPLEIQEIPVQRKWSELPNIDAESVVSTQGDHFYIKRLPAPPATWDIGIISSTPVPTLPTTPNYPLDTVLNHQGALDPADQGYILRWIHPAHPQEFVDYVMSFGFGSPLLPGGYGQFELVFGGDGRAFLFEYIGTPLAWVLVDAWRYAAAELVPGKPHTVRIIPHAARFLEVRTNITERGTPGFLFNSKRLTAFSGQSIAQDAHVYETTNRTDLPPRAGGFSYPVTGAGHPTFRVRRDILLRWQLARVTYPASGTLYDQAFTVSAVDTSTHVLHIRRFSMVVKNELTLADRGNTSAAAFNALTGAALAGASENWTIGGKTYALSGFTLPGKPNAIRVQITLTNNDGAGGTYSPWFFGYEAHKIGENGTATSTALAINETHYRQSPITRLSITGADQDPSHETASVQVIKDVVNRVSRLNVRGEGTIRVTTRFDPADASKLSVLFDGYWIKSENRLRGKAGAIYPSPDWTDHELVCLGQWKRLHERDFIANELLSLGADLDPTVPPMAGRTQPAKVTDAIRFMLVHAGVPESQTDIPDLPIRLWTTNTEHNDTIVVQPGTNCAEFIRSLAEDRLGMFLAWDACAGSAGMWRLKAVPSGTETSVWTFTDVLPPVGRIATHAGAYPAGTTWIARDTLNEWTVPPEGNYIRVTGEVNGKVYACEARNPKSYSRPGASTADPSHQDYTDGRFRPIFRRHDPTLLSIPAIQFVTRRTFEIACRAFRYARFSCPLPLIDAQTAEPTIYTVFKRRPLMFGDVVTYRGHKAMVRSCQIEVKKQHFALATIELTRFNDPLPA